MGGKKSEGKEKEKSEEIVKDCVLKSNESTIYLSFMNFISPSLGAKGCYQPFPWSLSLSPSNKYSCSYSVIPMFS